MRAAALLALLLAAAPAEAGEVWSGTADGPRIGATLSGFTDALPGSEPKRNRPYARVPALTLPDPGTARVVIWTHGTTDSTEVENCNAEGNGVPPSLRALEAEGVYLWFHCSQATVPGGRATAGDYIYVRMGEIDGAIARFVDIGVEPGRIFLAGHSAGGWTMLMMARAWGERIGGIIAYAPAFARPRADIARFPFWRREVMPRQVAEMRRAPRMRALVFAYENDIFDRPQELAFLEETWPGTVRLVGYTCDPENDHASHIRDCRLAETTRAVRAFVLGE